VLVIPGRRFARGVPRPGAPRRPRRPRLHPWLRDEDDPPAISGFSSPRVFYIGERNGFGVHTEDAGGSQRPDLREGVKDGCVGNAATAASVELEPRAPQCSRGEGDGRAGHVTDLNQTASRGLGLEVMPGERIEEKLGRVAPEIVQDDVEMGATGFFAKGRRQSLIWLVEGDDRIRPEIRQRLQDTRVASRGNHPCGAQVFGDLDGQFASDPSMPGLPPVFEIHKVMDVEDIGDGLTPNLEIATVKYE
jgi:hypothetical protein